MADRYPLIVNSSTSKIQELPASGNVNLHNNGIVNAGVITATGFDGPIIAGAGSSNIIAGINTTSSMRVGGDTSFSEDLVVTGTSRVTGILTIGTGSLTITDRDINAAGVATCGNFKTGSTNVHSVGVEAAAINSLGADTPIGAGSTIYNSGSAIFTGIVTAAALEVAGNITVGGELTYNDVKNVDSIGVITARSNINALGNIIGDGATNISGMNNFTATTFYGSGANLSGIDATQIFTGNTSVQTVDTGSDGHVKFTTEGSERLRVSKDGAIGLGGANYGSSGQVIHSQGSGSAAVWSTFQGVPSGVIMMWSGAENAIPSGWYLCNGSNSTPDLRNKFVIGASSDTTVTSSTFAGITLGSVSGYAKRSGGNKDATLVSHSHTLSHSHTFSGTVSNTNLSHSHSYSSANHPTGSGPEQNQTGSPEDRTTFNVGKTTGSALGNHAHTYSGTTSGASTSTTNTQGSSSTNANLPPYYSLAYIMKT